jgi:hypothetical protein
MSDSFNPGADPAGTGLAPAQNSPAPAQAPVKVGHNTVITSFNDDTVRQYDFDQYTGRRGQIDRIYLLRPNAIAKTRVHFHEKLRYVICNSIYEVKGNQDIQTSEAACCKMLGKSNLRFGALMMRYMTDPRTGNVIMPFQVPELRLWRFGVDKYVALRNIDSSFPLATHDLSVSCEEEQFQRLTIGAKPESIYLNPRFPADLKRQFEEWAEASLRKLPKEMGRIMADDAIQKELGQAVAAPATMQAGDAPITDFSAVIQSMAPLK